MEVYDRAKYVFNRTRDKYDETIGTLSKTADGKEIKNNDYAFRGILLLLLLLSLLLLLFSMYRPDHSFAQYIYIYM